MLTFHSPSMGEAFWSTQALDWTAEQTRLITHTQSLTVYLQQTQLPVRVQVLYSGTGTMTASEQAASQWPDKQPIFIREVVLRLNEMPVILARSICQLPHAHANHTDPNHFWLNLLNRGNHPLGLNLFHPEGQIQACTLHYAQFMPQFYAHAAQNFLTQSPLPARCRFFEHQTSHLLVTEFFYLNCFPFFSINQVIRPNIMFNLFKNWKNRGSVYAKLMRLDRPIGTLLLLWPTLWALVLGANGLPPWRTLLIFMLGTLLMRSAGCVINDYADRHIDGHVQRTKERPFAQGSVKPKEALYLAASLALMAFSLTFYLPIAALFWSIPAVVIAAIYPYTKRFFPLPQAVLGVAFSFGMPMAFVALEQPLDARLWLLFSANLCWVIAYDTIYALVDKPDDLKLGIRTSAITFGQHVQSAILMFHGLFVGLMLALGVLGEFRWPYWLSLFLVATLIAKQLKDIKSNDTQLCFQAFLHNNRIGCIVFLGLSGHYLL